MVRSLGITFIVLMYAALALAQEKEAIPQASDDPFKQAQYLMYIRDMKGAGEVLVQAQEKYRKKNDLDSLTLTMVARARMLTLTGEVEQSKKLVDSALVIMGNLDDTLAYTKALIPFVQSGNFLASYDVAGADSSGQVALEVIKEAVGSCHFIRMNMLNDHGIVQYYKNDYYKADSLVNESLNCANEIFHEDDMRKIPSLNLSGTIKDNLGYHYEATKLYEEAARIMRVNNRQESYDYARLLNNLAGAVYDNGGPLEAIKLYEESLLLTEKFEDYTNNSSGAYYNIANMLNSIGYRNKALEYLNISIRLMEENDAIYSPMSHYTYMLKASVLTSLDRYDEAIGELEKSRQIIQEIFKEDYQVQVEFLRRYAGILSDAGKHEKSLELIDSTLRFIEQQNLDIHIANTAEFYYIAGEIAQVVDLPDMAMKYYRKSVVDFISGSPRQQKQAALSLACMGNIELKAGRLDNALEYLVRADSILLGRDVRNILSDQAALEEYFDLQYLGHILSIKIEVLMEKYAESEDDVYLRRALDVSYVLEEEINEKISAYLEEEDAVSRTSEYYNLYALIVKVRLKASRVFGRKDLAESALNSVESTKDLLYKNALRTAVKPTGSVPDSVVLVEQRLLSRIERLENEITEAELNGDPVDKLQSQLTLLIRQWDEFKLFIQEEFPKYYDDRFKPDVMDVGKIQKYLKESKSTILQYFLSDNFSCVFVISGEDISYVPLERQELLDPLLKKAIQDIRGLGSLNSLNLCYRSFFKPVEKFIRTENVIIIPDGLLHFLPLEAFVNGKGEYLVSRYNFVYNHALGSINTNFKEAEYSGILSVAPGFEKEVLSYLKENNPNFPTEDLVRQPNALKLAQSAANYFSGKVLTGEMATESQFKNSSEESEVLLIATHATADEEHPLFSRISLLPDSLGNEDGLLYAYEILSLTLKQRLAVLSACQTGIGEVDRGQGASSLSQAFRLAGCENVIMSLWSIDEKQSVELLDTYLKKVSSGNSSLSQSLTSTKRNYLETSNKDLSHPFYWSGLVYVGSETIISTSNDSWSLCITLFLLLILFVYLVVVFRRNQVAS